MCRSTSAQPLGTHLKDTGHCCQEHADQTHSDGLMSKSGDSPQFLLHARCRPLSQVSFFFFFNSTDACAAVTGVKLTGLAEEELMKKWQEILGPSNEVIVSCFCGIYLAENGGLLCAD